MDSEVLRRYRSIAKRANISTEKVMVIAVALAMELIVDPVGRWASKVDKRISRSTRARLAREFARVQEIALHPTRRRRSNGSGRRANGG